MYSSEIQTIIQSLSETVMLVEADDLPALGTLHDDLHRVSTLLGEADEPALGQIATNAGALVETIMLRDCEDDAATLKQVVQHVADLQAVILDGQPIESRIADRSTETDELNDTTSDHDDDSPASTTDAGEGGVTSTVQLNADPELTAEFVTESQEHLEQADVHLLTIEQDPSDTEALNAVFRAFHTIKGVAGFLELAPIQELAHETETLLDHCRKGTLELTGDAMDVVFTATDAMKQLVAGVAEALESDGAFTPMASLPDLLPKIRAAAAGQSVADVPAGQTEAPSPEPDASQDDSSATGGTPTAPAGQGRKTDAGKSGSIKETIRVDAARLDQLVDIIGEMVIAEAMVTQSSEHANGEGETLGRRLNHLDKITRELQELAMSLRMVPVRSTFQRMARLARDVSKKLDKPINFTTNGEETELDKNVVDAIGDPLVHMVRNAVDHGIEDSAEDRVAAGKSATGQVELRAFHKGGSIHIEIEDDGKGLDRDKLLAKAQERGIVKDGEALTDSEVFNLIFEPGFSTAQQITDVSGRGVGLDVVKRNIQALRGKVDIRSEKGKGTVFSIRLPLTLAIIEGMVLRLSNQRFIVPTLSIVRMIRPEESNLSRIFDRQELLELGDRQVPLYRLDQMFHIADAVADPCQASVVVVEHDNRQVAFAVDELLGQQQIVIKPLGSMLQKYPGFSGGAIMPDGRVGLILDVPSLTSMTDPSRPPSLAA